MQDRLARHLLPSEATLLGVRLQPFTLWHGARLAALGSPLVVDGVKAITIGDLALAARVCQLPANASARQLWRAITPGPFARARQALHLRFADFDEQFSVWLEYFAFHHSGPKPLRMPGGKPVRSNQTIYLVTWLRSLGFSSDEAWAMTPGLSRWYMAAGVEVAGDQIEIVSDRMVEDALLAGYTEEDMDL